MLKLARLFSILSLAVIVGLSPVLAQEAQDDTGTRRPLEGLLDNLLGGAPRGDAAQGNADQGNSSAQETTRLPESREEMQLSFAPLVRQTAPAVVNVYAEREVRQR